MRGWVVLLWAILATVVLVAVGIFGTQLVTGRVGLFPTPTPTAPRPTTRPTTATGSGPSVSRTASGAMVWTVRGLARRAATTAVKRVGAKPARGRRIGEIQASRASAIASGEG